MEEVEITYFTFCYLQEADPMDVFFFRPQSKRRESIHTDPSEVPVGEWRERDNGC